MVHYDLIIATPTMQLFHLEMSEKVNSWDPVRRAGILKDGRTFKVIQATMDGVGYTTGLHFRAYKLLNAATISHEVTRALQARIQR